MCIVHITKVKKEIIVNFLVYLEGTYIHEYPCYTYSLSLGWKSWLIIDVWSLSLLKNKCKNFAPPIMIFDCLKFMVTFDLCFTMCKSPHLKDIPKI